MGAIFVYILKSSVCLALFYLFYKLLLSRDTFHRFNRMALLGLVALSVIIPFCRIELETAGVIRRSVMNLEELLLQSPAATGQDAGGQPLWLQLALLAYLGGVLFGACHIGYSFYSLFRIAGRGEVHVVDGIRLVLTDRPIVPFSWMNCVVINRQDYAESSTEIWAHEMAHIKALHSVDLFVSEICILFHWFNPAAWLLKLELQNIHEYEADERVLKQGIDAKRYQLLLIKKTVGSRRFASMANSFTHSSLKKRIAMMLKSKSSPWARLKYLSVLPLAAVSIAAFARSELSKELEKIFIDGVEVTREDMNKLNPDKIESMSVWKAGPATAYSEERQNDIIKIRLKK